LVVVPGEEGMEVALVLVVGIEARVRIGAYEVPTRGGRLQTRELIAVHAGRLGRVEDVRHVHEDGDVLTHSDSSVLRAGAMPLLGARVHLLRDMPAPTAATWSSVRGPLSTNPCRSQRVRAAGSVGCGASMTLQPLFCADRITSSMSASVTRSMS